MKIRKKIQGENYHLIINIFIISYCIELKNKNNDVIRNYILREEVLEMT